MIQNDMERRQAWLKAKAQVRELERPEREARKIEAAQRKADQRRRARENGAKIDQDRIKPKGGRVRDADYMGWIHESGLTCIACAIDGPPRIGTANPIEVAHQRIKGWKKGVRGDDADSVPLCRWHHQLAPNACDKGQRQFWDRYGIDQAEFCHALHAAFRAGASGQAVVDRFAARARTVARQPLHEEMA